MTEKEIKPIQIYDFTGLKCPLPVLKTKRALKNHSNGEVIEIIADDPAANLDLKHFCEVSGNILLQVIKKNKNLNCFIKKNEGQLNNSLISYPCDEASMEEFEAEKQRQQSVTIQTD